MSTIKVPDNAQPVIIVTEQRAVVFGYTNMDPVTIVKDGIVVLYNARNAFYWGTTKGLYELCTTGPGAKAKIGDTAPMLTKSGVHTVFYVAPKAVKVWTTAMWAR